MDESVILSFRSEGDKVPAESMIRYYTSSTGLNVKKFAERARRTGT
jgi:hypothetical protein